MSFFQRVASLATIGFAVAGLVSGTPGLAAQVAVSNAATLATVPPSGLISAIATTPVPNALQTDPIAPLPNQPAADDQDTPDFATLADAVAANRDAADADEALTCLAGAIYFESKGEPLDGQLAVAEVILNRAKSGRFPASVCDVVTQRGQFSFVRSGRVPDVAPNAAYRTALAVARVALAEAWDGPAAQALYFHTRSSAPGWGRVKVAAIGNHIFYR